MDPELETLVKKFKDDPYFKDLKNYLISKIEELNSVGNPSKMSNERLGEEVKARILAIEKLKEILEPFVNYREKKEPSIEDINGAKKHFAL